MQKTTHLSYPGPEDSNSTIFLSLTVTRGHRRLNIFNEYKQIKFPKQYANQYLPAVQERISRTLK